MDLIKAFDCGNHEYILKRYVFHGKELIWTKTYLKNKVHFKKYVELQDAEMKVSKSDTFIEINNVVPQGSILRSDLFILY